MYPRRLLRPLRAQFGQRFRAAVVTRWTTAKGAAFHGSTNSMRLGAIQDETASKTSASWQGKETYATQMARTTLGQ
jgi:hypothetical protein